MGVNSISFGPPHVRPLGYTCGEPNEIKKNTHPKNICLFSWAAGEDHPSMRDRWPDAATPTRTAVWSRMARGKKEEGRCFTCCRCTWPCSALLTACRGGRSPRRVCTARRHDHDDRHDHHRRRRRHRRAACPPRPCPAKRLHLHEARTRTRTRPGARGQNGHGSRACRPGPAQLLKNRATASTRRGANTRAPRGQYS